MNPLEFNNKDKITVEIDADLEDLMQGYLDNKRLELDSISESLAVGDFEKIRFIAHNMKGSGSAYGLDKISEVGEKVELAAKNAAIAIIEESVQELTYYLNKIQIVYVEE